MELVVIQNRQAVTTSLQVAENFEKRHDHILRDIEALKKDVPNFGEMFYDGETPDSYNRMRKTYYMNRDGFTLLAMGFNGKKALDFKLKYIEAFNQMEEQLKPEQPDGLELALQAALKHTREINAIKNDVDYLKGSMRIDSLQQQEIQQTANQSVVQALGGKDSVAYKEINRKVFSAFWNEFKQYFKVPRYGDIPKVKQEEALHFIKLWRPSTSLQMEIDGCNSQMAFE
ncbi:Rha family transcriptional regulator [Lysinibacillus sp. NPDC096418]|uniref:Rha family transcriptional regulator n=1 Tax=Lysinibacillus sp. NPDC096418 TaxID=3364138 RepID=UPI0037FBE515